METVPFNKKYEFPQHDNHSISKKCPRAPEFQGLLGQTFLCEQMLTPHGRAAKITPLSKREREVLSWAANGKSAWETAQLLGLTEATVKSYLANACRKLGAQNKVHAVALSIAHGLLGK